MKLGYNWLYRGIVVTLDKDDIESINRGCTTFFTSQLKDVKECIDYYMHGGMPKELECIKDDIEYIMEKAAKCKDRDKLKMILEALEVITAEI